jgi:hypothetical protein
MVRAEHLEPFGAHECASKSLAKMDILLQLDGINLVFLPGK